MKLSIFSAFAAIVPLVLCQYSNQTVTTTITETTITTLSTCPAATRCHGQTLTITGTIAIVGIACQPQRTCTCVLPPAPPVLPTCPAQAVCTGQVVTWSGNSGPTPCPSTCTIEYPGYVSSSSTTTPGNSTLSTRTPTPTPTTAGAGAVIWESWVVKVLVAVGAAGLV